METLQACLSAFQQQSNENMDRLLAQQMKLMETLLSSVTRKPAIDTRGLGRPESFRGEEERWIEWRTKLFAFLGASNINACQWIEWAGRQADRITEDDIKIEFTDYDVVLAFDLTLNQTLVCCTAGHAFNVVHSAGGRGLEAMRLLMKRYEPRTPGTKRAILKAILNQSAAKKIDEIEKALMNFEDLLKRYDSMSGETLPEDLRVTIALDLCTKDLQEHLEITTRDKSYREVREEMMSYVERKREQFQSGIRAMEVDNAERILGERWIGGDDHGVYWNSGGYDDYWAHRQNDHYQHRNDYDEYHSEIDAIQYKG